MEHHSINSCLKDGLGPRRLIHGPTEHMKRYVIVGLLLMVLLEHVGAHLFSRLLLLLLLLLLVTEVCDLRAAVAQLQCDQQTYETVGNIEL
jgi:hypothetical protein